MKKRLVFLMCAIIAVLVLGTLAVGCPIPDPVVGGGVDNGDNGDDNGDNTLPRAAWPRIDWNSYPLMYSDGEEIQVTLSTVTECADIFYTLSGQVDGNIPSVTTGTLYTGPITLSLDDVTENPAHPGYIDLQAVAGGEGFRDSPASSQGFQIFVPGSFGSYSGTEAVETPEGSGYYDGQLLVEITLTNGKITGLHVENGHNGTPEDTEANFDEAIEYAQAFFDTMNHWDYDVRTGSTTTSTNIRNAAGEAIRLIIESHY